ncbi:hypothetical protein [Streptomyces sp. 840.1]|uniref:hypothetical protein n=1 Tax=Streptomyces sp. 840.1 TaxID=2485152 RepID=UPI000F4953B6|nr:hypothetical protein [Streptomyces sp. 840.1]
MNTNQQTTRGLAAIEAYLYQEGHLSAARRRVMAFTETRDGLSREQKCAIESWYLAEQKYVARMVTEHIDGSVGAAEAAHHVRLRRWLRGTLLAMVMLNVVTLLCTAVVVGSVA